MMKKKNIAMAMAAVTMASAVAPVVANAAAPAKTENHEIAKTNAGKLVAKVRELLEMKFEETEDAVYTITATYKETATTSNTLTDTITKAYQLSDIIESKFDVVVTIHEEGHAVVDEKIESESVKVYGEDGIVDLAANYNTSYSTAIDNGLTAKYDKTEDKVKLTYTTATGASAKVFNVGADSKKLKEDTANNDLLLKITSGSTTKTTEATTQDIIDEQDRLYQAIIAAVEATSSNTVHTTGASGNAVTEGFAFGKVEDVEASLAEALNVESLPNAVLPNGITEGKVLRDKDELKTVIDNAIKAFGEEVDPTSPGSCTTAQVAAVNKIHTKYNEVKNSIDILFGQAQINKIKGLAFDNTKTPIPCIEYVVSIVDKSVESVKAEELFDGLMLSEEGEKILKALQPNGIVDGKTTYKANMDEDASKINKLEDGTYELVIVLDVTTIKSERTTETNERIELKITDADRTKLEKILAIFKNKEVNSNRISGLDRYRTAVNISKETSTVKPYDGAVVLVGGEAIVDGLAASPFAKAIEAPILLTEKDSLNEYTEREIKRLLVDNTAVSHLQTQTVYIVGGESVVSNKVVETIEAMGIKVERLAGDDRESTSLAVAEKMAKLDKIHDNKTFVVGGNGEADAMSIAAHAAAENAPIIVTTKDSKLSADTKKFLDGRNIDIIGGISVVTEELEEELKAIDADQKIVRTKGDTRFETNANVIKNYYKSGVDTIYVAKDGYVEGNDKLVDALAISKVAANKGVIVLATEDLTTEQSDALGMRAGGAKKLTQVGGGVSETVVNKLAKMLGFIK